MPPQRNINSTHVHRRMDQKTPREDEQYKNDIKSIRKQAEQDFLNTLTHHSTKALIANKSQVL